MDEQGPKHNQKCVSCKSFRLRKILKLNLVNFQFMIYNTRLLNTTPFPQERQRGPPGGGCGVSLRAGGGRVFRAL